MAKLRTKSISIVAPPMPNRESKRGLWRNTQRLVPHREYALQDGPAQRPRYDSNSLREGHTCPSLKLNVSESKSIVINLWPLAVCANGGFSSGFSSFAYNVCYSLHDFLVKFSHFRDSIRQVSRHSKILDKHTYIKVNNRVRF